jgi:predicted alpha/beta hydrolase family esterase
MDSAFYPYQQKLADYRVLLLPGYLNSPVDHWMSIWERNLSNVTRVIQDDWENPNKALWIARLEATVQQASLTSRKPILLVAHSLGCLLASEWANLFQSETNNAVKGALLVAPPDPESDDFPSHSLGFEKAHQQRIPFASSIIASTDDPSASIEFAQLCANYWGSTLINVGKQGHINADSHLGNWTEGLDHLCSLVEDKD